MWDRICPGAYGTEVAGTEDFLTDPAKRNFLRAAGMLMAGSLGSRALAQAALQGPNTVDEKVILVVMGGVRRDETFGPEGIANIPHLVNDLAPQGVFYAHARNEGVTAHFNAISSILTGNWQRVDDWGKLAPTSPTIFEQYRKSHGASSTDTWVVASNKALTTQIGASSVRGYGPDYGANVVFPKQLMLMAVVEAMRNGRTANMADRARVESELQSALEGSNYEGLGWNVFDAANELDPRVRGTIENAIGSFVHGGGPTSGDELTFFMTREIMRKFTPRLVVVVFSDVEAAHFGSYSLHTSGIRTADRLTHQLWQEVEANAAYKGKTTMVVLPEFGRDPDGSNTNGFFNHRANHDSTRDTWMLALGSAVDKPQTVERKIHHVDFTPTIARLLGAKPLEMQGLPLPEFLS